MWDRPVRGGGCPCRHFVGRAELYDPLTGSWTPTGSVPAEWGTAALLADGIALVFGADGAARYDPRSGSWATVGAPPHEFLTTPQMIWLRHPSTGPWTAASRSGCSTAGSSQSAKPERPCSTRQETRDLVRTAAGHGSGQRLGFRGNGGGSGAPDRVRRPHLCASTWPAAPHPQPPHRRACDDTGRPTPGSPRGRPRRTDSRVITCGDHRCAAERRDGRLDRSLEVCSMMASRPRPARTARKGPAPAPTGACARRCSGARLARHGGRGQPNRGRP